MSKKLEDAPPLSKTVLEVMYIIEKSGIAPEGLTTDQIVRAVDAYIFVLQKHHGIEV